MHSVFQGLETGGHGFSKVWKLGQASEVDPSGSSASSAKRDTGFQPVQATGRMPVPRWVAMLLAFVASASIAQAQYVVNFEGTGETKTAYASGNVTLSGISWNMTDALIGTSGSDRKFGS